MGNDVKISVIDDFRYNETAISINRNDPNKIIAASNTHSPEENRRQAQFYSADGGLIWKQTFLEFAPKSTDVEHNDPCVEWTSDGIAWAVTLAYDKFPAFDSFTRKPLKDPVTGLYAAGEPVFPSFLKPGATRLRCYKSDNGGASWIYNSTPSVDWSNADRPTLWVDHGNNAHKDNMYVIWNERQGRGVYVNYRQGTDGAWHNIPQKVSQPVSHRGKDAKYRKNGVGGDIKTNGYGDVFAFWPDNGTRQIFMVKSDNGGESFSSEFFIADTYGSFQYSVPAQSKGQVSIYISGGAYRDDTRNLDLVYATWADLCVDDMCKKREYDGGGIPSRLRGYGLLFLQESNMVLSIGRWRQNLGT